MEAGVSVVVPELLLIPDQYVVFRLALSNVKVLGSLFPPFSGHVKVTLETVTSMYGFVTVILITFVPSITLMFPAVIVLQLAEEVEVLVGVEVDVAVAVLVAVGVLEGTIVGVLLGSGVIVTTSPGRVTVGVTDTTVAVAVDVNVLVGKIVPIAVGPLEPGVLDGLVKFSRSSEPMIVRALDEVRVREPIGIRFTMGL